MEYVSTPANEKPDYILSRKNGESWPVNGDPEDMLCLISLSKRVEDMFKLGNEKTDHMLLRRSDDG